MTKLKDHTKNLMAYWSILKTFLKNKKKIHCTPPIYHNYNYIADFKEMALIFNNFFAKQSTLVENTSKLLTNSFKRTNNLSISLFTKDDIAETIKNLNPNKTHSSDMFSICMFKICSDSILKTLELIFKSCTESGKFSIEWKKANVAPVE